MGCGAFSVMLELMAAIRSLCWLFVLTLRVPDPPDRSIVADRNHSSTCVLIVYHAIKIRLHHMITRQARAIMLIECLS